LRPWSSAVEFDSLSKSMNGWTARRRNPSRAAAEFRGDRRELVTLTMTRAWDPAIGIIVATARVLGAKLITTDDRIVDAGLVETSPELSNDRSSMARRRVS